MIQVSAGTKIFLCVEIVDFRCGIDGQGFWLLQKRLSQGTFCWWPTSTKRSYSINMYELQILLGNGNPREAKIGKDWRKVS